MKSTQLINGFFSEFEQSLQNIIGSDDVKINEVGTTNNDKISQSDLMSYVHTEFQKPHIKSAILNPKTNYRTYWIIVGSLQLLFDDMNEDMNDDNNSFDILFIDVSLERIQNAVKTYLRDNGYPQISSQLDAVKLIRDTINNLQEDGITKISDTIIEVGKAGITADRFTSYINQMKKEGSVFEPREGCLKCV